MKLLQVNITANWGSHGRIAEDIGQLAISHGWESYLAYGRTANPCKSHLVRIGSMMDERWHGFQSRLFDNHGLASVSATRNFLRSVDEIKPDIVHLHNIHGYYLNYPLLFQYLSRLDVPVVWTLHDCWSVTGHCAFFTYEGCEKWKSGCHHCECKYKYPQSLFFSRSEKNYIQKQQSFTSLRNLTIVPVSQWLGDIVNDSFLSDYPVKVIHNGIDLNRFRVLPDNNRSSHVKVLLGVSSVWEKRKGLDDFVLLRQLLDDSYRIILIGLTPKQIASLPPGIEGISRTNNVDELIYYYNLADVFVNPTYEDNFPTTNLEALACGTPVVTYNTGGSPEAIDDNTGIVVEYGNVNAMAESIETLCSAPDKASLSRACRERAEQLFNKDDRYKEYLDLYNSLV